MPSDLARATPAVDFLRRIRSALTPSRVRRLPVTEDPQVERAYVSLPSTRDMLNYLTVEGTSADASTRIEKGLRITAWGTLAVLGGALCYALMVEKPPRLLGILAIACMVLFILLSVVVCPLLAAIRQKDMFVCPGRFLATQLDTHLARETALAARLKAIREPDLTERLLRVDSQINALEKWIDVARVMWLLGPLVVLLFKSGFHVSDSAHEMIQMCATAGTVGILMGAAQMRVGIRDLQRVSFALKIAVDRSKEPQRVRKVSRKRTKLPTD